MNSSTRIRFGAFTAAAAIVAGGFLASAPANAATGTIDIANVDFTEGDWGTGLDITGSGFNADSTVTITVSKGAAALATEDVPADTNGDFATNVLPTVALPLPAAGEEITVSATSDQGDDSNTVTLNVTPLTPPAPAGPTLTASATTITTAELTDPAAGLEFHGTGFAPGEKVSIEVTYVGQTAAIDPETADANGEVLFGFYMESGTAVAGPMVVTATGENNNQASATVQVTGEDITVGGGDDNTGAPGFGQSTSTGTASVGQQPTRLPAVAG